MPRYRFADFEVRQETGEIFKSGHRVRLQPQPFQILCKLLERPGELVTRQDLASALWGNDTWTDAERGINVAIKKLRDALSDSAEAPRLIETLPKRGYRFIGQLEREQAIGLAIPAGGKEPAAEVLTAAQRFRARILAARRGPLLTAAIIVAILGVAVAYRQFSPRPVNRAAGRHHSVLVGLFVNETGEKELDGVVESALEARITDSPTLSVASGERVRDALRLMRRPAVDRIPLALAEELGRRDPGIRAMIGGTIQKLGAGYLLTARILRNGSGEAPAVLQASARDRDGIFNAVGRLSEALHRSLGEDPPAPTSLVRPDRVTTSSPEAFRLYSDANELAGDGNFRAAELLLRKALELDARFASAYILLAYEIRNQSDRSPEEYIPLAERAMSLSGDVSEEEAYFIRASYQFLTGNHRQAMEIYEAMLKRFPEHIWANNNLYRLYLAEGLSDRMRMLIDRQLKIRPNDPTGYYRAGFACLCADDGTPELALQYASRGLALARESGEEAGWADADVHLRALAAWMRGDLGETLRHLQSGANADTRAAGYLTLGRFRQAEAAIEAIEEEQFRDFWALWRAVLAGESEGSARLSTVLASRPATEADLIALLRAGWMKPADGLLLRLKAPRYGQAVRQVAAGELSFRQGRGRKAIEVLTPAVAAISRSNFKERILGAMTLSEALVSEGRAGEAAAILESATARRGCGGFYAAMFWPSARRQLMELYSRTSRESEAAKIRAELDRLSAQADRGVSLAARLPKNR